MCASPRNVIIPTPPHPTPLREKHPVCVASNMCASARYVIIPTPPHPTPRETSRVRRIKHVCKSEERHHPHPTPPREKHPVCVASNMCASARYVIIPTPPHPTPRETSRVRSIKHVCKSEERHHPHPTPPREKHPVCVASNMCASARYVIIPTPPHPTPRETSCLRIIKHVFKWKKHHQSKKRTSRGR